MNYGLFLQHASAATVATVISHTAVRGLKKAKKKVAEELSAQQLDEFKDVFADLEKDGDGSVTTKGFETSIFSFKMMNIFAISTIVCTIWHLKVPLSDPPPPFVRVQTLFMNVPLLDFEVIALLFRKD